MTGSNGGPLRRRIVRAVLAVPGFCLIAACTTLSLEDAAPTMQADLVPERQETPEEAARRASAENPGTQTGALRRDGDYPNLNIPPVSANIQIDDAQRRELTEQLSQRRAALAATGAAVGPGVSSAEELRRLGAAHGDSVLAEIEAEAGND